MFTLNRLKTLVAPLALVAAMVITPAVAEAGEIATINVQKILAESSAAKSAKKQIDTKREQYQKELKDLETRLQKEEKALMEQKSLLAPDALAKKQQEFAAEVGKAQQEVQKKRERLGEAYNSAVSDIQKAVIKIVEKLAKERNFKMVVPTNNVVYATSDLDITNDVLVQLDKDLQKVTISFE